MYREIPSLVFTKQTTILLLNVLILSAMKILNHDKNIYFICVKQDYNLVTFTFLLKTSVFFNNHCAKKYNCLQKYSSLCPLLFNILSSVVLMESFIPSPNKSSIWWFSRWIENKFFSQVTCLRIVRQPAKLTSSEHFPNSQIVTCRIFIPTK